VYPIERLRALPLEAGATRMDLRAGAAGPGWSARGIAADFPLRGFRSMYGATKLASELLIEEYRAMYGLRAVINRCGVISGPWQMGKVDQGFVVLWAARHLYGGRLSYIGFGGKGLQVRDVLHVEDLYDLLQAQMSELTRHSGSVFNVGGGLENSVSLAQLSGLCRARAGAPIPIDSDPRTNPSDVPYYVSDNTEVTAATGWMPKRRFETLLDDVFAWLREHRASLEPVLASPSVPTATGVPTAP
jgi:CDP-paratose 2-epimerase